MQPSGLFQDLGGDERHCIHGGGDERNESLVSSRCARCSTVRASESRPVGQPGLEHARLREDAMLQVKVRIHQH